MKDGTFYFPHDFNAQHDPNIIRLLRDMSWRGYGLYWAIVEKLYNEGGPIIEDIGLIAFDLRAEVAEIKKLIGSFDLFYRKGNKFGSRSVDRRIAERLGLIALAKKAGKASVEARKQRQLNATSTPVERLLNVRSTDVQPERNKEINKEIKITTAKLSASPVDFSEVRVPFGERKGVHVANLPADEAAVYLKSPRLGKDFEAALRWRIAQKNGEMTTAQRRAQGF